MKLPQDSLKWVTVACALAATATAEYELARAVGMQTLVAAAVPGALDAYVVRSLRVRREVLPAVLAMVGVNAASHLLTAGVLKLDWVLITSVSAIAPLVLWRVHALGTPKKRARKESQEDVPVPEHASTEDLDVPEWVSTPKGCVHKHAECSGADACTVYVPVTPAEHVVHVPYKDHVTVLKAVPDPVPVASTPALSLVKDVHAPVLADDVCQWCGNTDCPADTDDDTEPYYVHANGEAECTQCSSVFPSVPEWTEHQAREHAPNPSPSTRTAAEWDTEHVSTGTLRPADAEHMSRARELFHTHGSVPTVRALKESNVPGVGTPRAQRLRRALVIENGGE